MSSRPRLVGPPRPNNTSFLLNGLRALLAVWLVVYGSSGGGVDGRSGGRC